MHVTEKSKLIINFIAKSKYITASKFTGSTCTIYRGIYPLFFQTKSPFVENLLHKVKWGKVGQASDIALCYVL